MREGKQKASGDTAVDEAIPRTRLVDARPFLLLETLGWMPGAESFLFSAIFLLLPIAANLFAGYLH